MESVLVLLVGSLVRSCSLPNVVRGVVVGRGLEYPELVAVRVRHEEGYLHTLYFFPSELELDLPEVAEEEQDVVSRFE